MIARCLALCFAELELAIVMLCFYLILGCKVLGKNYLFLYLTVKHLQNNFLTYAEGTSCYYL